MKFITPLSIALFATAGMAAEEGSPQSVDAAISQCAVRKSDETVPASMADGV
jgi:hypothetical protein